MSASPDMDPGREQRRRAFAPPQAANRIFELSTPEDELEFVLGDMAEEFEDRIASETGQVRARLWYCSQSIGHASRRLIEIMRARLKRNGGTDSSGGRLPNWEPKRGELMRDFMADFKFAGRGFRRNPRFIAIVVITLALGIGANTVIFGLMNSVMLTSLPYGDPDEVVVVWGAWPERGIPFDSMSGFEFAEYRGRNQVFDDMAAHQYWDVNLTGIDEPRKLIGYQVTGNMFDLLDVAPMVGRTFTRSEDLPGGPNVVVLSHRVWSVLGSDNSMVGRQVSLNNVSHEVIGVMGEDFGYPQLKQWQGDLWVPMQLTEEQMRSRPGAGFTAVGRLHDGVTLEQSVADMDRVAIHLESENPARAGRRANPERYGDQLINQAGPVFLFLSVAVGFVLLIACANVANLLLARASSRQGEIAIRASLGAGKARLLRQLFTESILLAVLGGAAGFALSVWANWLLSVSVPDDILRITTSGGGLLDTRVLGFTLLASLLTGVLFGMAPAWRLTGADLQESLKGGGLQTSAGAGRSRLRSVLVVSETAMSVLLLIGAGLFIRSFLNVVQVDPGFTKEGMLTVQLALPEATYDDADSQRLFFQQVVQRVGALPGVEAAAAVNVLPLSTMNRGTGFRIDGQPPAENGAELGAGFRTVTPDYFRVMGIPVVAGREFDARDSAASVGVVMVTQSLADRYFGGESPLGKRIYVGRAGGESREIVGVVGDVRHAYLTDRPVPELYLPHDQVPGATATLVMRTATDPSAFAAVTRDEVWAVDPNMPVDDVRTMEEVVSGSLAQQSLPAVFMGVFAGIAVLLTAVGLYGVMAYLVSQRTREIGIRMALGATSISVIGMVIKRGLGLATLGAVPGLFGAFAVGRLMEGILFGVDPADPWIFGGVIFGLGIVVLLATAIPARRAANLGALAALRLQ